MNTPAAPVTAEGATHPPNPGAVHAPPPAPATPPAPGQPCPLCGHAHPAWENVVELVLVDTLTHKQRLPAIQMFWHVTGDLLPKKTWANAHGHSDKHFRALAARLGVHAGSVEELMHAYQAGRLRRPTRVLLARSEDGQYWNLKNVEVPHDAPALTPVPPVPVVVGPDGDARPGFPQPQG